MEERAEGIILRTRPLTDTSTIVEWITGEFGILSTVAKGARRPKSPFAGKLDIFFEAQFSFVRSKRSELHALREVQVTDTNAALRASLALLHQAAWFTVLLEQATERETPVPEVYNVLQEYLDHLPSPERVAQAMFLFEFRILRALGFEPDRSTVIHSPASSRLLDSDFNALPELTREDKNSLNRWLRTAIATSLERLPLQREQAIRALIGANKNGGSR